MSKSNNSAYNLLWTYYYYDNCVNDKNLNFLFLSKYSALSACHASFIAYHALVCLLCLCLSLLLFFTFNCVLPKWRINVFIILWLSLGKRQMQYGAIYFASFSFPMLEKNYETRAALVLNNSETSRNFKLRSTAFEPASSYHTQNHHIVPFWRKAQDLIQLPTFRYAVNCNR